MDPIDGTLGDVFGHALDGVVVRPAIVTIKIAFPFGEQVRNDRAQLAAVPARLKVRGTPTLPGSDCVELLIFLPGHRQRIGFLRVYRFRQEFFRHRLELWGCFRFVKYLMKLLIYAEWLGGSSRIKVLLNFCHVVSSPNLGERPRTARRTIKSKSRKNSCQPSNLSDESSGPGLRRRSPRNQGSAKRCECSLIFRGIASLKRHCEPFLTPGCAGV